MLEAKHRRLKEEGTGPGKSGELTAGPARGQAPLGTRAFPPWHRVCTSESVPAGLRRLGQAHPGLRWPESLGGCRSWGLGSSEVTQCHFCHPLWSKQLEPVQIQEGTRPYLSMGEASENFIDGHYGAKQGPSGCSLQGQAGSRASAGPLPGVCAAGSPGAGLAPGVSLGAVVSCK